MAPALSPEAQKLRDALFLAASRTYAEQYIEPFIRAQYKLDAAFEHHDAIDPKTGERYEIKAAKVLTSRPKAALKLLARILAEIKNTEFHRMVPYAERYNARYCANIQNVKRDHFDFLICVLLFSDKVVVFQIAVGKINGASVKGWSEKHGLYDQIGKSGQFNINKNSIVHHESNYAKDAFTYEQLLERYETL